MPDKQHRTFAKWHGDLYRPRVHKDRRNCGPPPSTTAIYPEGNTKQSFEELLRAHSFQFGRGAENSKAAASSPRNRRVRVYFNKTETMQQSLEESERAMLSHMGAKDDTAKAKSYNAFSEASILRKQAPTDKIDFNSVTRGLFIGACFAEDPKCERFWLPQDSELPNKYHKYAAVRYGGYDLLSKTEQEEMHACVDTAVKNSIAHYCDVEDNPSQAASSTGDNQETERANDSEQTQVQDENDFELDAAMMARPPM